jgi:hypothetical protein
MQSFAFGLSHHDCFLVLAAQRPAACNVVSISPNHGAIFSFATDAKCIYAQNFFLCSSYFTKAMVI